MSYVSMVGSLVTGFTNTMMTVNADKVASENQQAQYNANALAAETQGEYAKEQAAAEAQRKGDEWDMLMGQRRANAGARGVALTSPSVLGLLGKTAEQKAFDVDTIVNKGQAAYAQGRTQANLQRWQGQVGRKAAEQKAGQDLLQGLSSLAGMGGGGGGGGGSIIGGGNSMNFNFNGGGGGVGGAGGAGGAPAGG